MQKQEILFKPFLEGKHIYLRGVSVSDATGNYHRWMHDPDVIQYLESRFVPSSVEMLQAYIRREEENPASIFMAIIMKDTDEHIGNIKVHRIDCLHRHAEVSLIIGAKEHWGKGYGTEAIRLVVGFAFGTLNLHKLTAAIYAPNVGSVKAFKKANFIDEGLRREHRFYEGNYIDEIEMAIIRMPHKSS